MVAVSRTGYTRLKQFHTQFLKKVRKNVIAKQYFLNEGTIFPCWNAGAMRRKWRKNTRLLGDNTSGGAIMLRPITFQCDGVWISNGLPRIYVYS